MAHARTTFSAPKASPYCPDEVFAADTVIDGEKMTQCWNADLAIDKGGNPLAS